MLTASPVSPLPEVRLAVDVEGLAKVFGSPSAPVGKGKGVVAE
jgi:hypothetical protein